MVKIVFIQIIDLDKIKITDNPLVVNVDEVEIV